MNIRRRLLRLEYRPFRRPVARRDDQWILPPDECEKMRSLQRKLCLPLPDKTTPAERAHALELFKAGRDRIRIDFGDTAGLDALKDYALSLHRRYGSVPHWDTMQ